MKTNQNNNEKNMAYRCQKASAKTITLYVHNGGLLFTLVAIYRARTCIFDVKCCCTFCISFPYLYALYTHFEHRSYLARWQCNSWCYCIVRVDDCMCVCVWVRISIGVTHPNINSNGKQYQYSNPWIQDAMQSAKTCGKSERAWNR